jgi:hypothetical protein
MPPDSFTLTAGQARSLTLTLPDGEAATVEYRITRDAGGRFREFPFYRGGAFYQAAVFYDDTEPERISKITLDNPAGSDPGESGDSTWDFEFLEYHGDDPSLARINAGGTWYFAALEYLNRQANETWYDPDGLAQAFFSLRYREASTHGGKKLVSIESRSGEGETILVYDYDSAGRISSLGLTSALYTAAARPRYWERPEGTYTLQWDEQGFLARQTAVLKPEEQELDIQYAYTLDEHVNWTERRAISRTRHFGRMVPDAEVVIRRSITYGDADND